MIDTRVFNKSQIQELYQNKDLYLPKIRFISNPFIKLQNGSYHPKAIQTTLNDLKRCSTNFYENERECMAHALDYFEFKNLPNNEYKIYFNFHKLHKHYDPQIYVQGVTISFDTIEKFKVIQRYIPSDMIISCTRVTTGENYKSQLVINGTKNKILTDQLEVGALLLVLGCDLQSDYWNMDLNSRIASIGDDKGDGTVLLELIHDIFLSDIYQDIDLDSSSYPNQTLEQILMIYEGYDSIN